MLKNKKPKHPNEEYPWKKQVKPLIMVSRLQPKSSFTFSLNNLWLGLMNLKPIFQLNKTDSLSFHYLYLVREWFEEKSNIICYYSENWMFSFKKMITNRTIRVLGIGKLSIKFQSERTNTKRPFDLESQRFKMNEKQFYLN